MSGSLCLGNLFFAGFRFFILGNINVLALVHALLGGVHHLFELLTGGLLLWSASRRFSAKEYLFGIAHHLVHLGI